MQKITFVGSVVKAVRSNTVNDTKVANFTVAVNREFTIGDKKYEHVDYIDVAAWGGLATVAEKLDKGARVMVVSTDMSADGYKGEKGDIRSNAKVKADDIVYLYGKSGYGYVSADIVGFTGKDFEMRYSADGKAFGSVSVAVDTSYYRANGETNAYERVERTTWFKVRASGKRAESMDKWVKKGNCVHIEGSLTAEAWEKDGNIFSVPVIRAAEWNFEGLKATPTTAVAVEKGIELPF